MLKIDLKLILYCTKHSTVVKQVFIVTSRKILSNTTITDQGEKWSWQKLPTVKSDYIALKVI